MKDSITFIASSGGLCNRLRAIGVCLSITEYLELDRLQLIWFPNESCPAEFEELFVSKPNQWQSGLNFKCGPSAKWCWNLDEMYKSNLVVNSIEPEGAIFRKLKKHYNFEMSNKEFEELYCRTIKEQFVPIMNIRKEIWEFKDKYNISERVGIQIRDMDEFWDTRSNQTKDFFSVDAYRNHRNEAFKKIMKNSGETFFSADNKITTDEFSVIENSISFPKTWHFKERGNAHRHRSKIKQATKRYRQNNSAHYSNLVYKHHRTTDMEDAVIDLFLLSECKELFLSDGSSFGIFASKLGNVKATII